MAIFPRLSPEFPEKCCPATGLLGGLLLCHSHLQPLSWSVFFSNWIPKEMRVFFPLGTCKGGCALESSEGTGYASQSRPDFLCSAQAAELTTTVQTSAMFLGSVLWPRDFQDFSLSQSGVWASPSAPPNTLPAQTIYFGKCSCPPPTNY